MAEHLTNKTQVFISSASVTAATDTAAEYTALTWAEITNVFDLGEFGDLANAVETSSLKEGRVRRLKGRIDGGQLDLIVNRDTADTGQTKLAEAAQSPFDFGFKVVLPDKLTTGGTGTTFYFRAAVLGGRTSFGEADSIARTTWSLAINSERLEVAAS